MAESVNPDISKAVADFHAEVGRIFWGVFEPEPERPYVGNRCGWYPARPKNYRGGPR